MGLEALGDPAMELADLLHDLLVVSERDGGLVQSDPEFAVSTLEPRSEQVAVTRELAQYIAPHPAALGPAGQSLCEPRGGRRRQHQDRQLSQPET